MTIAGNFHQRYYYGHKSIMTCYQDNQMIAHRSMEGGNKLAFSESRKE